MLCLYEANEDFINACIILPVGGRQKTEGERGITVGAVISSRTAVVNQHHADLPLANKGQIASSADVIVQPVHYTQPLCAVEQGYSVRRRLSVCLFVSQKRLRLTVNKFGIHDAFAVVR